MTCAQGLLRLLWGGGPKLECYGTEHRILYPRSANKQTITAPETTADSTNPRTAEEEAETNQQALTITLTRDTRKCLLNSSSGSHQASQRTAMSFFRGE